MTLTRAELRAALDEANVRAFLAVIRDGEGTSDADGYRRHFGGRLFDGYAAHPRTSQSAGGYVSSAAGAYQFLTRTWDGLQARYGFEDFAPQRQDEAAVALIAERGALPALRAGRLAQAIELTNVEWASLPGSPYGQPTRTLERARLVYLAAGGRLGDAGGLAATPPAPELPAQGAANDAPLAPPTPPAPLAPPTHPTAPAPSTPAGDAAAPPSTPTPSIVTEAYPMLPFVAAALPALIEAAPALIRVFGDSPQAERNAKAAEVVADVAKRATAQATIEGAVNAIRTDPARAAAYREAVHATLADIMLAAQAAAAIDEASRGQAADRAVQLGRETGGKWLWLVGGIAAAIVLASYAIVTLVLLREGFSDETRALLLGQVVILGFGTVVAFLFGSNMSNRVEQIARQRERDTG